ncbi:hypothetical protein V2J09_004240 [Rumex salicifolius]
MTKAANQKRRELEFQEGDLVFLKLRPHCQASLIKRVNQKLAARFYGPFRVLKKIGTMAYQLELPPTSKIHPVFHVSLLKKWTREACHKVLVAWEGKPLEDASWMTCEDFKG